MNASMTDLADRLLRGEARALGRAISIVEDGRDGAAELVRHTFDRTGRAAVYGFTGPPGAGKSTLIGALTRAIRARDRTVGVISVDPSSPFTRGAVLGDRVRLSEHYEDAGVFIRSMANRGALGGLAEATLLTIGLVDAYGADDVLVETVGVGQTEVDIVEHTDTVVLILMPGSGDAIQAVKAGIMEIPDIVVVNKSDHPAARKTVKDLRPSLSAGGVKDGWKVPILLTEAIRGQGVDELLDAMHAHHEHLHQSGTLEARRRRIVSRQVRSAAAQHLLAELDARLADGDLLREVLARRLDPGAAAERLVEQLRGDRVR